MYKWTDEDGNVQYGEKPPSGTQAQRMKGPSAAPSNPGYEPPTLDTGDDKGQKQTKQEREKIAKENCENARNNVKVYTKFKRVKQGDKVVELKDHERKRRLEYAKRQVKKYCK